MNRILLFFEMNKKIGSHKSKTIKITNSESYFFLINTYDILFFTNISDSYFKFIIIGKISVIKLLSFIQNFHITFRIIFHMAFHYQLIQKMIVFI